MKNFNFEDLKSIIFFLLHKCNQTEKIGILEELDQWTSFRNHCTEPLSCMNIKEIPCVNGSWKSTCLEHVGGENTVSESEECLNQLTFEKEKESLELKVENSASKNESCLNCQILIKEKETLELALSKEKENQKSLNSTIEEIEQDLSDTFMHKCQLQEAIIEIGKMFDHFKKKSIDSNFSETKFGFDVFSKTCLCESCVKQDGEITHSNDAILSAETFALWIDKVIKQYSKMKSEKEELKSIKSQETASCNSDFPTSVQIYEESQRLESEETGFPVLVDQCKEKVQSCEEMCCGKLSDYKNALKLEIASKEESIKTMQETIKSQREIMESTCLQSKAYKNEIAKLESKIKKYEMTESQEPVLNAEKEKLIISLQQEVKALQKSNDTLNLSIEKTEQEIRTLSVIKQGLEENVNKLSLELTKRDIDIETWKEMYETEKKSKSELTSKVQTLEIEKIELEEKQTQFDILKKLQEEHQTSQLAVSNSENMYEAEEKSMSELTSNVQKLEKEKIELEEKLQQIQIVNHGLKQDLTTLKNVQQEHEAHELDASAWKDMYESEKNSTSELLSRIEQLEIEKIELEETLIQFEILNNDMEQDVTILKKIQQEHQTCQLAVSNWKNTYEIEKKSNSELTSRLQQLEKEKIELGEELKQFQIVNDGLEQDVSTLKNLQREHEHTLLAKNHSLKEKDHVIQMLQGKYNEIELNNMQDCEHLNELQHLRLQLKEMSENASCLEKKVQEIESENIWYQETLKKVENERDELKNKINLLKQNVDKFTQDLEMQKNSNLELNRQLEIAKIAMLKETELHRSAENSIKARDETISSLNSSLEQNLDKISQLETQILIMKNENKKLLENDLVNKQVMLDLKKDIFSATQSLKELESEYSKLSTENSALLEKRREMSIVSESEGVKQVADKVKKIAENIFNLIEEIVKGFPGSSLTEQLENDLNSIKRLLRQGLDFSETEFSGSICENLKSFFKNNLRNTEEELKIYNLISSISDSVNCIGQFLESIDSPKTLHFADNTVNVTFNESYLGGNLIERTGFSHGQIIKDLHQTQELLENYFSALKTTVLTQADKCKDLKFKLDQALSKISSSESQECNENFVPKWKFKLVRVSAQRWEQEANKMKGSYAELKKYINVLEEKFKVQAEKINSLQEEKVQSELEFNQRIRTLEEENKRLDEEAEELSEDYKKLEHSENMDKLKLYETIDALKQKLEDSAKEYNQLRNSRISK